MEKKLIDISAHNDTINWTQVKAAGIAGAIIRCGFGDDISSQDDAKWKYNADECTRLGIPFGVYIYSYANSDAQSRSEAAHVLRLIKGYKLSYPVYLDLEESGTEGHAVAGAKIFCDLIKAAGYQVGIYANQYWFNSVIGNSLDAYTKWVANYGVNNGQPNTKPSISGLDIWQYTSVGSVNGIAGNVDMNICYRDFPAELTGTTSTSTNTSTSNTASTTKKNLGKVNITMQGYTTKWWSPVVNNSDWVGQADGVPLKYLAVKVDKGTITGRVYTQKNGWLPKLTFGNSYNINDLNNGVLGDGSPIQAVELYYNTPSGYNYQKVYYQVSGINSTTFYSEQADNEKGNGMDGYAGVIGVNIDKIKAYIK